MASRRIPIALIVGVLLVAQFALNKQPENNGSWDLIKIFTWSETHLGGTNIPIQIPRTGIAPVDSYFTFMTSFFAEALNPKHFRAHVHLHKLLGTLGSGFLLMLVEAHRGVGSSTFRLVTYLIELGGELLGVGLFTPIWCIVHLSLTNPPSAKGNAKAVDGHWGSLGYAFVLGHIFPTALQILTKPDGAGLSSQQLWTILRLFHPLFVLGLWNVFKAYSGASKADEESSLDQQQSSTRKFYLHTILYSATFHLSTFALLFSSSWIPNWLQSDVVTGINANTILGPAPFWTVQKGLSFADAVATFLQWDDICVASALIIWSASLYIEALPRDDGLIRNVLNSVVQTTLILAVAGSVAASAFLLQERDCLVSAAVSGKKKKH